QCLQIFKTGDLLGNRRHGGGNHRILDVHALQRALQEGWHVARQIEVDWRNADVRGEYRVVVAAEVHESMTNRSAPVTTLEDQLHCEPVPEMTMERVMGFEPTTFCLGSRHSTTELHPPVDCHSLAAASLRRKASMRRVSEHATGKWSVN